jgi:hypothetical protein
LEDKKHGANLCMGSKYALHGLSISTVFADDPGRAIPLLCKISRKSAADDTYAAAPVKWDRHMGSILRELAGTYDGTGEPGRKRTGAFSEIFSGEGK